MKKRNISTITNHPLAGVCIKA
uniref:Uncharacterized protein n=1 Tax=Rhizophora mucronata TaxID=61149 RepID=A0A2P2QYR7_RHIMU